MSEEAGSCVGQKLEAVVTFYRERRPTGATWWRVFYYSKFYMFYRVGPGWDEPEDIVPIC